MSEEDRQRWNARYAAGEHLRSELDPFFSEALERVERESERGTALDVACGTGLHALELARRGWSTSAWDVSDEALRHCREAARADGLAVETRRVDLHEGTRNAGPADAAELDSPRFGLVVVVDYLERSLLPALGGWLEPGGWLIYATFAPDWPGARPSQRFRIDPAELLRELRALVPVASGARPGRAEILARRPERNACTGSSRC